MFLRQPRNDNTTLWRARLRARLRYFTSFGSQVVSAGRCVINIAP
jgi:hypothetical protein